MKYAFYLALLFLSHNSFAQYKFESSTAYPFGKANPLAPPVLQDFAPMIGLCDCTSSSRKSFPDTSWNTPQKMIWKFKYIMNGTAVQDETLKSDGVHSGSIRQYNQDSSKWYVHYYSNGNATSKLASWKGNKTENGAIILYKEQPAPNGTPGFYKITFYDISLVGFKWLGAWVNKNESYRYPTWRITCKKRH